MRQRAARERRGTMSKFKGNFNAAAGRHTYFSERNRAGDYCRGGPASSEHRGSIVEYLNSYSSRFFVTFAAPSTFARKNWKFSIRRFAIAWINGKEKGEGKNRKWKKKKAAMKYGGRLDPGISRNPFDRVPCSRTRGKSWRDSDECLRLSNVELRNVF